MTAVAWAIIFACVIYSFPKFDSGAKNFAGTVGVMALTAIIIITCKELSR